jgi:hypothetical protein
MLFDWVSFLAYPNLFGIKGFVVVVENLKHLKFLYPIRFQYEKFNESDKSKFEDHLIYFFELESRKSSVLLEAR